MPSSFVGPAGLLVLATVFSVVPKKTEIRFCKTARRIEYTQRRLVWFCASESVEVAFDAVQSVTCSAATEPSSEEQAPLNLVLHCRDENGHQQQLQLCSCMSVFSAAPVHAGWTDYLTSIGITVA